MARRDAANTRQDQGSSRGIDLARRFLPYLVSQWQRLSLAYLLTLLGVFLSLAMPWPMKYLIDIVLSPDAPVDNTLLRWLAHWTQREQILVLSAALAVIALGAAIALTLERVLHARLQEQFSYSLRSDMIRHIYRIGRLARQQERSGELTMRLTGDAQLVARLFCKTAPVLGRQLATTLFTLGALFLIEPRVGLLATLITVGFMLLVARYRRPLERAAQRKRQTEGEVAALTQEAMAGIEHVQAMALEERATVAYLHKAQQALRSGVNAVRVAVGMERASQIYAGLSLAMIAATGGFAVISGDLTLGTLTVCLAYVTQLMKPIEKINEGASSLARGIVRAQRIDHLFRLPTTDEQCALASNTHRQVGPIVRIEFRQVAFRYPDDRLPTVIAFNHAFIRGELTVLTGASGSGKSTLLRLLLRLLQPDHGEIVVNGMCYDDVDSRTLRSQFAVLMQDAFLFAGTLRDVLCEMAAEADDHQLQRVLEQVALLNLVESLPNGLYTPLGEAATRLSGGQRSRLLLARAIVSQRQVLILDEPFANIDADSRTIILGTLQTLRKDRIVVVVTHEESLLSIADHVLTPPHWSPRPIHRLRPTLKVI